MRIKITGGGIYGNDGEIPIGTEVTVKEEPTGWAGRYEVISGDEEGKTPILNAERGEAEIGDTTENSKTGEGVADAGKDGQTAAPTFAVKDKGAGWFVVTKDGQEATKSFRKADLEGFDAMSAEDKAAFVEANKPE
jgi:hypothetical protein